MPQSPLSACKYEVNNILFAGSLLVRFGLFLHGDKIFFREVREIILKGLPDGGIKGDKNIDRQTLDAIISCVSLEMKDTPIEKQLWFQTLQERKISYFTKHIEAAPPPQVS